MTGGDDVTAGGEWAVVTADGLVTWVNLPEKAARQLAAHETAKSGEERYAVPNHLAGRLGRERQRLHDLAMRELRRAQLAAAGATLDEWQREQAADPTGGRAERPYHYDLDR